MTDEGLLTSDMLLRGYAMGIFPMAETRESNGVFWLRPKRRGVIPLDGFHLSRSLARTLRRAAPHVTLNASFSEVMRACAAREETWINEDIHRLYGEMHSRGHAHSLEVWNDTELWGAIYGVTLGTAFFGESMVSPRRDGSKIALAYLVCHLRNCGFTLFDTQFVTPHLQSLGACEISRSAFQKGLSRAMQSHADIQACSLPSAQEVVSQLRTQTS
ncbi:MAG: leucyl/phenylalanyl-tRNA--protein transferase [Pseudomonadota bacterium]